MPKVRLQLVPRSLSHAQTIIVFRTLTVTNLLTVAIVGKEASVASSYDPLHDAGGMAGPVARLAARLGSPSFSRLWYIS